MIKKHWTLYLIITLVGIGLVIVLSYPFITRMSLFMVKGITIEGNSLLSRELILSLSQIQRSTSLFDIEPNQVREKIITHPLVEEVYVERNFPDEVEIQIREQEIIASLANKDSHSLYYITNKGILIEPVIQMDQIPSILIDKTIEEIKESNRITNNNLLTTLESLKNAKKHITNLYNQIELIRLSFEQQRGELFLKNIQTQFLISDQLNQDYLSKLEIIYPEILNNRMDFFAIDLRYKNPVGRL